MSSALSRIKQILDNSFPAPKYLTFDPVAIDISPTAIHLAKLRHSRAGLVPEVSKIVRLKKSYNISQIADENKIDPTAISEIIDSLRALKKEFGLKYVVASLPEMKTYIFRTKFPVVAAGDIASSIRYNLEENVPLPLDEVNFDYFVVDGDADGVEVVVNVYPKKIIAIYTKIFQMAGLTAISFQSESVALARAVVTIGDADPYLLIRLLEDRVNIAIVEDNVVQYASTLNVSPKMIAENLESSPDGDELKAALNRLLIFWFTNREYGAEHRKIQTAYVSGAHANFPGMLEFLERHLKISVEKANVWTNCFSLSDYVPQISKDDSLNFDVAIGLAIKAIKHT